MKQHRWRCAVMSAAVWALVLTEMNCAFAAVTSADQTGEERIWVSEEAETVTVSNAGAASDPDAPSALEAVSEEEDPSLYGKGSGPETNPGEEALLDQGGENAAEDEPGLPDFVDANASGEAADSRDEEVIANQQGLEEDSDSGVLPDPGAADAPDSAANSALSAAQDGVMGEGCGGMESLAEPGDTGVTGGSEGAEDPAAPKDSSGAASSEADGTGESAEERTPESAAECTAESMAEELPPIPELADERSLIPAEAVSPGDLAAIVGDGIDNQVDEETDAVTEILRAYPSDEGLLQFAAQEAGHTSQMAREAAGILTDSNAVLPSEVAEALANAGLAEEAELEVNESLLEMLLSPFSENVEAAEDHQSGPAISYTPADSREGAMAYLSSFALSDVKDGSGDWDDPRGYTAEGNNYDWNGNDSDEHNSVVRTNDDVTYTFSYTTALTDSYIYNTISGTKLYVEYTLPHSTTEAVFNLEAMPWLMGDGPDGGPVVYYTLSDGSVVTALSEDRKAVSQRLVGYRDLPDRTGGEGVSYDVPGAGTLNCVISVKEMITKTSLAPVFHAWLEAASGNDHYPDSDLTRELSNPKQFASVSVTSGPYVSLRFLPKNYFPWTLPKYNTFSYYDGNLNETSGTGRLKGVHFEVIAGKPNGNTKGSTSLDPSKAVTVTFSLDAWTSDPGGTLCGLCDLRTGGMGMDEGGRLTDGEIRYYFHGPGSVLGAEGIGEGMDLGASPSRDAWAGQIRNLRAFGGIYTFDIEGYEHFHAGETLSTGEFFFYQKMPESSNAGYRYYTKITVPELSAVSALDPSLRKVFSQSYPDSSGTMQTTSATVENAVEGSGTWDSHLNFLMNENGPLWGGDSTSVSASFPYGETVYVYKTLNTIPGSSSDQQQSMLEILLWDSTKMTLPKDVPDEGVIHTGRNYGEYGATWRLLFITAASGDSLDGEAMKTVSLLSYRDLRYFLTRQAAASYLQGRGKPEENIVGIAVEWFGKEKIPLSSWTLFEFELPLVYRTDVPADEVIGTSVQLTQNVLAFRGPVINENRSIGGVNGQGSMITTAELGDARMIWPNGVFNTIPWDAAGDIAGSSNGARNYDGTRWVSEGHVDVSSLTAHNNVHAGNSFYVSGYQFMVTSNIVREGIGGEADPALTIDLGGRDTITYEVKPAFDKKSGVRGVGGYLLLPSPTDEGGSTACLEWKGISAVKKNGEVTELKTDGRRYQMSDFVEGAEGSFSLTLESSGEEGPLMQYFNEGTYTNDYYDGKVFLLVPEQAQDLALSGDDHPGLREKNLGDPAQQYCLRKTGKGYAVRNAATGKYLVSSGASDGDSIVRSDNYSPEWTARTSTWYLEEHSGGSVSLRSSADNSLLIYLPGREQGTEVLMKTDDQSQAGRWKLIRVGGETAGAAVAFEGLSDDHELPTFYPEYRLVRGAISTETLITQRAVVAGDSYTGDPASAKDHVSSTGLGFVEVFSNVIKETVDTAEVKLTELNGGRKLCYEISYTNLYHSDHSYELVDELPHTGDEDGTALKEGALVKLESLSCQTDGGSRVQFSSVSEANASGRILSSGTLHSGETLKISFLVSVSGAAGGNVLRNSTLLEDEFGSVRSNRVETVIKGMMGEAKIYKQVNRISNDIGELHTWTVTATIPEDLSAEENVVYRIKDGLDQEYERLAYEGNVSVHLLPFELAPDGNPKPRGAGEGEVLSSGSDYVLAEPQKGSAGGTLELTMTQAGLAKLEARARDRYALQLCFDTSIRENAIAGVHIPNHANLEYGMADGGSGELRNARSPEPDPYVYTGDIPILKRDIHTKEPLGGAAFTLYRDEALQEVFQRNGDAYSLLTGQDGKAVFHGVKDGTYYLMETRAAPGHELAASAYEVVVLDGILVRGTEVRFDDQQQFVLSAGGSRALWTNLLTALLLLSAALLQLLKLVRR